MRGVTRGAIYWHFKDKNELYREVVKITLDKADVVKNTLTACLKIFLTRREWSAFSCLLRITDMSISFYNAINLSSAYKEFDEFNSKLSGSISSMLFRYFVEETRMHIRARKDPGRDETWNFGRLRLFILSSK